MMNSRGFLVILCCILLGSVIHAQSFAERDTVLPGYFTGGKLDSVDLCARRISSTIPGGQDVYGSLYSTGLFITQLNGQLYTRHTPWGKMKFSGVPHMGLSYSFGNKGTQFAAMEYQQSFGRSVLLNLEYTKLRSNAFLRNNSFNTDHLQVLIGIQRKVYSSQIRSSWERYTSSWSGGVITDTLLNEFAPGLIPVRKENASGKVNMARLEWDNYVDLDRDSLTALGILTEHHLSIRNRRFFEEDTIYGLYNTVLFDSLKTEDQAQLSSVLNAAGAYLVRKQHALAVTFYHRFWNFQNMGLLRDTTETGLRVNYSLRLNRLRIKNETQYNLSGAKNEYWQETSGLIELGIFDVHFNWMWEDRLPDPFLRNVQGNNYLWNNSLTRQQRSLARVGVDYSFRAEKRLQLSLEHGYLANNFLYHNDSWIVQPDPVQVLRVNVRGSWKAGPLYLHPGYVFSSVDGMTNYLPKHVVQARLLVKGGLFKSRKMLAYAGVDASWSSSASLLTFSPYTDSYDPFSATGSNSGMSDLHVFGGFQLDGFRFFVRVEHLGYFWNDRTLNIVAGYPYPSLAFRLGVTWDFFN